MTALAAQSIEHAVAVRSPPSDTRGIPNINPATGLSTDYLNHFTEAIMVLEIAALMPDCLNDLRAWRPKTYSEHFYSSRFSNRDAVIAAYNAADPAVRDALDSASETLNAVLVDARDVVLRHLASPDAEVLAQRAVAWLKPLIARTAAVINGTSARAADNVGTQAAVDALFHP
jgi:hypothetical protein